ncbi:hypothetical protein HN51_006353 [Arachis hypogaea]|uniref:coumaroyl-CoA:anthocyanidin 3-O-glucoside-6''-O-coumaroyltransferase 1-like n=1 Tax=Arachis hypogaea TaxID=3818 RepID=UPI000DECC20E|nr:coumaroyl-CoA:anthocyanidin 3-O-glucoside-6''-O-coumaroyltransferase 1-like [Arachis hypogaea]
MENKVMNHDDTVVKVIEQFQVGPPPGSVPSPTSISLSFFDVPYLSMPITCKRIFFYEFPYSKTHFLQKVLPNLRQSLSLTLKHFFPFSSNIVFPQKPQTPHILYSEGDTLTFIVAESTTTNLDNLVSDTPKDVTCFHPFVPMLPSPRALEDGTLLIPPMAIQVTIFPNSSFAICINFSHVVVDGKGFHHFMKFWASVCGSKEHNIVLPSHDRNMIEDPNGLKPIFLETVWNSPRERFMSLGHNVLSDNNHVRLTFVLTRDHVDNLKKYVSTKCQRHGLEISHLSTFVVTCSLLWVCKIKLEQDIKTNDDEELYLCFWLDCRTRNIGELEIPSTYFGNCLVNGIAAIKRSKLVGQNGIFEAAIAIGSKVREMQSEPYKCAERLKSIFSEVATIGHRMLRIASSPKLDVYETDFGWGKPKLSEVVHLHSQLVSLSDCRDKEGGIIEVGVALGRTQIHKFNTILEEELANIVVCD